MSSQSQSEVLAILTEFFLDVEYPISSESTDDDPIPKIDFVANRIDFKITVFNLLY